MSIVTIATPFNIDLEFKTAAFNKRFLAWLIDLVIICAYNYIVEYFILRPFHLDSDVATVIFILFTALPSFLYNLIFETFFNGQSIGKKLAGVKVISRTGNEATFSQYLIRWLLGFGNYIMYAMPYIIEAAIRNPGYIFFFIFVLLFYIPDLLSFGISSKSQRLGDLAAGTVVIDNNYDASINETIYLEIEDEHYMPLYPQVMRLTDRDINGIRNLLDVKNESKDNYTYTAQVAARIKEVLSIESDLESSDFLLQLLRDYNYLTRKY